jgi:hypothetical protein
LAHAGKLCFVSNIFFIGEFLPIPYLWQAIITFKLETKLKILKKLLVMGNFIQLKFAWGLSKIDICHFQMAPSCMISMPNSSILCLRFVICGHFKMISFVKLQGGCHCFVKSPTFVSLYMV